MTGKVKNDTLEAGGGGGLRLFSKESLCFSSRGGNIFPRNTTLNKFIRWCTCLLICFVSPHLRQQFSKHISIKGRNFPII